MRKINSARLILFALVGLLHGLVILFAAFRITSAAQEPEPAAEVMKLVDLREEAPPPPPRRRPAEPVQNTLDPVAQTMVETDEPPPVGIFAESPPPLAEPEYLPMHKISTLPAFSEKEIRDALVYPPIARRSNTEGLVYLELFVDAQGEVRRVTVLREDPPNRGFGEAAARAFRGIRGTPALANGSPVAVRYRYPVRFRLN
jgi:protein TonB